MHTVSLLLTLAFTALGVQAQAQNPKKGLIYIPSSIYPADDNIFVGSRNAMTWYYSYQALPAPNIVGKPANLEFVPMLWGDHQNNFINDVRNQVPKPKYVLGFNEPDMRLEWGGSSMTPQRAVEIWRTTIQPLAADGIKLGAPGVSGALDGRQWIVDFMRLCTGCTIDFIPLHSYGDFGALADQIGWASAAFPGKKFWITEFNFAHQDLRATEDFYLRTMQYIDGLASVERYSWFGAFRSDVSNVGPNGAMLNAQGQLTQIGRWYLGK